MLRAAPVTIYDKDYLAIRALYCEAFPRYERYPLLLLRFLAWRPEVEFLAFYDCDEGDEAVHQEGCAPQREAPGGGKRAEAATRIDHGSGAFDGRLCGLSFIIEAGDYLYILYLAVDSAQRGSGYGTRILDMLHGLYPNRTFVLEIEPLDKTADNYDQRVSRLAFYERNGFHLAGYDMFEGTVNYTMLATGDDFDPDKFATAVRKLTHGLLRFRIVPAQGGEARSV